MRTIFTLIVLSSLTFLSPPEVVAQCNTAPCITPLPSVNAQDACVLQDLSALTCYYGMTTTDAPVSLPPSWCTSIENNHWFAFTANAPTATFTLSVLSCTEGVGLQMAILSTDDCINFHFVSSCLDSISPQTTGMVTATGLTIGQVYYLCIDGVGGSLCDYLINGSTPSINSSVQHVCLPSTATVAYSSAITASWSIQPPGAGVVLSPTIGTQFTVHWLQTGTFQVCVENLQCPNAPPICEDVVVSQDAAETWQDVNLCPNGIVSCAGTLYTFPGSYTNHLMAYQHCDSVVHCNVHLLPVITTTEVHNVCQGASVSCAGQQFSSAGTFPVVLTSYQGCDSTVKCKIVIIPTTNNPAYQVNKCGPATYSFCGNTFNTTGLYAGTCTSIQGCDSIVNVDLAILEPEAIIAPPGMLDCGANATLTLNGSGSSVNNATSGSTLYKWMGPGIVGNSALPTVQINQPGDYCLVVTHGRGGLYCSDTTCVTVTALSAVPQLPQITGLSNPCANTVQTYSASAVGTPAPTSFHWTAPNGIPFTVLSPNSIQITWSGAAAGMPLCVTAQNTCGTSPAACLPVTVQPAVQTPVLSGPASVCAGGGTYLFTLNGEQTGTTYTWTTPANAILSGTGDTVNINFQNASAGPVCVSAQNTCGSTAPVCQNVQVMPVPTAFLANNAEICAGESVQLTFSLNGNGPFDLIWTDGSQNFTLTNVANGHVETVSPAQTTTYGLVSIGDNTTPAACTAALTGKVKITVWQPASLSQTTRICAGETLLVGGALQTVSGVYTDSLQTVHGCDSIVTTLLTVHAVDSVLILSSTCDPAAAGTMIQIWNQLNGCDSVVTTTVVLLPASTTHLFDTSCDPANVGVFTQHLFNHYGCDSTVTTTITYALSDTTWINAATCDAQAAGVFFQNFTTIEGCDSLIITTVALLPLDTVLLAGISCDPADAGVFIQNLSNLAGCDSIVITTITQVYPDTAWLASTTCDPAAAGIFTQHLTTVQGCDSLVISTVQLLAGSTTLLTDVSCNPANVGVFTQNLLNQAGCDSTVVTTVYFSLTDTTLLTAASCDPTATGVFTQNLISSDGCDSTVITMVSLLPTNVVQLSGTSCDPASVGVFTQHLSNHYGCDSLVITTVTLLPSQQVALQSTTCDPAAAGVFSYLLINQYGCDSTVTETVLLLPRDTTYLNFGTCDPLQAGTLVAVFPNHWGCDSTVMAVTSLLPPASCSVTATLAGSSIPCGLSAGSLTLTATLGEPPFDYTVLLDGTPVAGGTLGATGLTELISGLAAGHYTVQVHSANGFNATVEAGIVQLVPPNLVATVAAEYNGYAISCTGETDGAAQATATGGVPPYGFSWSNGAFTPDAGNLGAGNYTVIVTDAYACTSTATVTLNEPPPLQCSFRVNDLDCFGQHDGAIFAEASGGVPPYRYALGNGNPQSSNGFSNLQAGTFSVTTYDANDCQRTEIMVVNAAVPLLVELGDNQVIEQGESTILQAVVNVPIDSILTVDWTPPFDTAACPSCLSQVVAPFVSTTYSVLVTALNGCSDADKTTVIVDRRRHLYIPNVFSPDNDGQNDQFVIYAKPGSVRAIKSFQVFDRWGELLFAADNFQPNDPANGWDGRLGKQAMNPGVFVWSIEVEFIDGVTERFEGDVTLVR